MVDMDTNESLHDTIILDVVEEAVVGCPIGTIFYDIKVDEGDAKIIKNGMETVVVLSGKSLGYRILSTEMNSLWRLKVTTRFRTCNVGWLLDNLRSLSNCSTVDTKISLLGRITFLSSCLGSFSRDASLILPPTCPKGYWVAMEINLLKPLVLKLHSDGFTYKVEYEGLPQVCFKYGRVSRAQTLCPMKRVVADNNCFAPNARNIDNPIKTSREDSSTSKNRKEFRSRFELLIVEEDSHTKSVPPKLTNASNENYAMKSGPSKLIIKLNENPFSYVSTKGKKKTPHSKTASLVSPIGHKQDHLSLKIKPSSLPNPFGITPKPTTIMSKSHQAASSSKAHNPFVFGTFVSFRNTNGRPNTFVVSNDPLVIFSSRKPPHPNKKRGRIISANEKSKPSDDERGAPRKQKISMKEAHVVVSGDQISPLGFNDEDV
ncbi:conserved hypothetical protein [Ricinus communis]|uniref:DUF4283 domain-containing protein n=1 Tax=Ricinus communis TaxID=3988 RepID=B9RZ69_RICCO|nr:conserved hypothetical protein [Ricinus communis]